MPPRLRALVATRLPTDAFLVAGGVLVAFRLLAIAPWDYPTLDLHAYWATRDGLDYASASPFVIGAYLYAPVFAQAIAPLTLLPWPVFAAAWTALMVGAYAWIAGRWSLPLLLTVAVALDLFLGQIDLFIAAAIVAGFRWPAVWAFPLLTKVAPGVGLVWFAVRQEWRNLAIAIGATAALIAVSGAVRPDLWGDWFDLLRRSALETQGAEGTFLPIPLLWRLPFAIGIIAWGARADRRWTVPVGVLLAMPVLWVNVFTLLIAVIPLRAGATTPAAAWLRGADQPSSLRQ